MNPHLSGIVRPPIKVNNFELKPILINLVQLNQFGGALHKDTNNYLTLFLELCVTIKFNGVFEDAIKLRLFPFSLWD